MGFRSRTRTITSTTTAHRRIPRCIGTLWVLYMPPVRMAFVTKPRNDYVSFRPYKAIGTTRSAWRSGDGPLRAMIRAGAACLLFIGLPSLVIVPGVVYYLAGFENWPTFLGHTVATFAIPAAAIAALALLAGVVSICRLLFRR